MQELDEMRIKAILWENQQRSREIAEDFKARIESFNAYEDSIGDSTKRISWIDPKDGRYKRVKDVEGGLDIWKML